MQRRLFNEQKKSILAAVSFPEVSEVPVSWGERNLQRADKYKAIVNLDVARKLGLEITPGMFKYQR